MTVSGTKTFMVYGSFTEPSTKLNFIVVSMPERGVRWRAAMIAVKRVIQPWFERGSKARERSWNVDGDVDGAKKVGALHFEWKDGEFVQRIAMNNNTWIVICRADRKEDGSAGDYELATRQVFETRDAAETYLAGISESREPLAIPGDFRGLRLPS